MWTKIIINFLLIFAAYLSVIILYIVFMTIRQKSSKTEPKRDSTLTGFKKVQKFHKA